MDSDNHSSSITEEALRHKDRVSANISTLESAVSVHLSLFPVGSDMSQQERDSFEALFEGILTKIRNSIQLTPYDLDALQRLIFAHIGHFSYDDIRYLFGYPAKDQGSN